MLLPLLLVLASCTTNVATVAENDRSRIVTPTSVQGLLSNLKIALVGGLLLSPEFFSDEQLRVLSGASTLRWISNGERSKYVLLDGDNYLPLRSQVKANFSATWGITTPPYDPEPGGKVLATFLVNCACKLGFEDIHATFGIYEHTVSADRRNAGTHYALPPKATVPLGNQVITYRIATQGNHIASFDVWFDPDGNVDSFKATEREN